MRRYCRNVRCLEELDAREARRLPMGFCPSCRAAASFGFRNGVGIALWLGLVAGCVEAGRAHSRLVVTPDLANVVSVGSVLRVACEAGCVDTETHDWLAFVVVLLVIVVIELAYLIETRNT